VGYGRKFRDCLGSQVIRTEATADSSGGSARVAERCATLGSLSHEDVQAARKWLEVNLAPSAVGIQGMSMGGMNCMSALSRDPEQYAAGACWAGVFNWVTLRRHSSPFRADGFPTGTVQQWGKHVYRQMPWGPASDLVTPAYADMTRQNLRHVYFSSPVAYMHNVTAPILIIHGDLDANVPFQEAMGAVRALRRRRGNYVLETLILPDEQHYLACFAHQVKATERIYDFFAQHLQLPPRPS